MIANMILGSILVLVGVFWISYILDLGINKLYLIGAIGLFIMGFLLILSLRWTSL